MSVTFGEKRKKKSKLSTVLVLCYLCYLVLLTLMRMTMLALVYENSDGIWSIDSWPVDNDGWVIWQMTD